MTCLWTIEGKGEVVRLGDVTTHGGKVITASANVFYDGIPIARVGDQVSCPKCGGIHTIVTGSPSAFDHGAAIACHDDLVSCGATLIARNAAISSQNQSSPTTHHNIHSYDEQVRVFDENGESVKYIPFFIRDAEEREYKGFTDENGCCPRIYTSSAQNITIYLGVQALERWPSNV